MHTDDARATCDKFIHQLWHNKPAIYRNLDRDLGNILGGVKNL